MRGDLGPLLLALAQAALLLQVAPQPQRPGPEHERDAHEHRERGDDDERHLLHVEVGLQQHHRAGGDEQQTSEQADQPAGAADADRLEPAGALGGVELAQREHGAGDDDQDGQQPRPRQRDAQPAGHEEGGHHAQRQAAQQQPHRLAVVGGAAHLLEGAHGLGLRVRASAGGGRAQRLGRGLGGVVLAHQHPEQPVRHHPGTTGERQGDEPEPHLPGLEPEVPRHTGGHAGNQPALHRTHQGGTGRRVRARWRLGGCVDVHVPILTVFAPGRQAASP